MLLSDYYGSSKPSLFLIFVFGPAVGIVCPLSDALFLVQVRASKKVMKRVAPSVAGLLNACAVMVEGARTNGADDWLSLHEDALSGETNPDSLYSLCCCLAKHLERDELPKRFVPKEVTMVKDEALVATERLRLLVLPVANKGYSDPHGINNEEEVKVPNEAPPQQFVG